MMAFRFVSLDGKKDIFLLKVDLRHQDAAEKHKDERVRVKSDKEVRAPDIVEIGIDLKEFYKSVEWDILGVPASRYSIIFRNFFNSNISLETSSFTPAVMSHTWTSPSTSPCGGRPCSTQST